MINKLLEIILNHKNKYNDLRSYYDRFNSKRGQYYFKFKDYVISKEEWLIYIDYRWKLKKLINKYDPACYNANPV